MRKEPNAPPPIAAKPPAPPGPPPVPRTRKAAAKAPALKHNNTAEAVDKVPAAPVAASRYKSIRHRMVDPDTGIAFSATAPISAPSPRKDGWLASQLAAGVIIEV